MLRAGFAGSGFAAAFHYDSIVQSGLSYIEPHGVFSPTVDHRDQFANDRGIVAYKSLDELLDNIDVVHLCLPAAVHEHAAVEALRRNVQVIHEKPFTGYFGPGEGEFSGNTFSKEIMKREALASARRIMAAEQESNANIYYAENWMFTPVVQKETEILRKTKGQILWMIAEEAHSGSHSSAYGVWSLAGGGSLMGKGCHPLTTVLYLKQIEGITRNGTPIKPKAVTSRIHEITRLPAYEDLGHLRTDYKDVEDWGLMHVVFEDGTIADVYSSEIVMGGVHNWIEVFANNHRTRCNINPVDGLQTYNPVDSQFDDIYVVEKIGTKQGWSNPAADENWMTGYVQEIRYFYECIKAGEMPLRYSELGYDTVDVIYSAYLSAERGGSEVPVGV